MLPALLQTLDITGHSAGVPDLLRTILFTLWRHNSARRCAARPLWLASRSADKLWKIVSEYITDAVYTHVRRRVTLAQTRVASIVSLTREHGGHPRAQDFLDRSEDFELAVDYHIVIARIPPVDIVEFLFFMQVDQNVALHSLEEP